MTTEDFIKKAIEKHGDKYDYSEANFVNSKTPIKIICHQKDYKDIEHGIFYVNPYKHLYRGDGCPKCSGRGKYKDHDFLIQSLKKAQNDDNYSYDKVVYKGYKIPITITCKIHGDYEINIGHALNGQGCPKCRYIKSADSKRRSIKEIIELSRKVHGDKYDYSLIKEYKNDRIKYPIKCNVCGNVFYQAFNNHIKGKQGCPICGRKKTEDARRSDVETFIKLAKEVHNNKYDYSKVEYINSRTPVKIICPEHGDFWQRPDNHLSGAGCPSCSHTFSNEEEEVSNFIKSIVGEENVISKDRSILNGKEIDIYVPSKQIGIEFNGLRWHSEEFNKDKNYHLLKTEECAKKGIRLIHIFEDEWISKKEIWKSMLKNIFEKTENKIYARKCEIKNIEPVEANKFLLNNHIQGVCSSSIKLGLYYNNELVSLMTFSKTRHFIGAQKYDYELLRFCNKINTCVIGGASKLLKHFIEIYKPKTIVSYADRRWSTGNLYHKLGFNLYNISRPNYFYIIKGKRKNRINFQKSVLVKKYNCPENMSEHEFCLSQHWYRIYDCGCLCYELNLIKR